MNRRTLVALALATSVSALATAPVLAQDATFRVNVPGNEDGIAYRSVEHFSEVLSEKTQGALDVKLFHSSALGDQESSIEAMQSSILDMATIETPITAVAPVLGATALPYIFSSREHVKAAMDGEAGEMIEALLAEKGLRVVGFLEGGFRQITNNVRPVVTPEDLKGIKIRTPGSALRIAIFNHYGANASPLPFSELYSALQTGVFDGQENPVIWAQSTKFYEVQKYLSLTNHLYTVTYLLMAEDKYQALTDAQKQAVLEAGEAAELRSVELGIKADAEIVDYLIKEGMEVNKADIAAFTAKSGQIWTDWAAKQGPEAQQLIDLIRDADK
tara:strand:- start:110222 stop:111211 length:990 start_codon:yes stop_codon:yes gene_type:complete